MKKWLARIPFDIKAGVAFVLFSFVVTALVALMFSAIPMDNSRSYWENYWLIYKILYVLFGASATFVGVLIMLPKIPTDDAFGFGMAIYYGTTLGGTFFDVLIKKGKGGGYLVAFIIVVLICYIVYLKGKLKK